MTIRVLRGATTDALTNCYIKDRLIPTLKELQADYELTRKPFSILILDVDHFKSFNDKHGHMHGDEVLKYFSSSLHLNLVDEDNIPFRFGGDEFVEVFPGRTARQVYGLAGILQKNIKSRMFLLKGKQYLMSFSGGIATYPDDAKSVEELLQKADKALYCSKRSGRARTIRYNQIFLDRSRYFLTLFGVAALFVIGGFFYREDLSNLVAQIRSARLTVGSAQNHTSYSVPASLTGSKGALDEVYLKSGDILVGRILVETAEEIRINLKLDQGEATLAVKKADILKIKKTSA